MIISLGDLILPSFELFSLDKGMFWYFIIISWSLINFCPLLLDLSSFFNFQNDTIYQIGLGKFVIYTDII